MTATDCESVTPEIRTANETIACGGAVAEPPGVYADLVPCSVSAGGSEAMETHAQSPSVAETPTRPQRRRGAPSGNRNAVRHGLRCGSLGKGNRDIENVASTLRQGLEAAVLQRQGEVTILAAALIQSAVRHEQRAMLAQKWLRTEGPSLPVLDRAALLKQISDASDSRDRCLEKLKLDKTDARTVWSEAFQTPQESPQPATDVSPSAGENVPQAQSTEAVA